MADLFVSGWGAYTHTYTQTHTQIHTDTHTQRHTLTHRHTQTHIYTNTHTDTHRHTHRDTYTLTHTQTHKHTHTHKQHVSEFLLIHWLTRRPGSFLLASEQDLLNINPLHSQLNKKVGTHSHAMLVLNKVRQFIVVFLITVLIGEKSAPIYLAITESTNVYASLFYGFMFYTLCLSFAHVEVSTSYCIF